MEKYHKFLNGGITKNAIWGIQIYFIHPWKAIFRHDFEGFKVHMTRKCRLAYY